MTTEVLQRPRNPWEHASRLRKAMALIAKLQAGKITAELASRMNEAEWRKTAKEAKVKAPSAETVALVIEALKKAEEEV